MKASDYIASYLELRGVTHVFELVGGMITFLLDSLHQRTGVRIVSMHHEQAAGFAAEGYGRMRGVPGVAMATSGPGATNLLTAIASCYFDSTPTVFITGQVNRHEQKGDRAVRQMGFQETDIVAMAAPVTKAAWLVNSPEDLPRLLDEAFALALAGRPGPVLLDIPMDVQRAEVGPLRRSAAEALEEGQADEEVEAFLTELARDLAAAERPLILAGGGIRAARCVEAFRGLTQRLQIPVVHSLMAVDAMPAEDPLRVGLIGSYGNRWANTALWESDLLIVLGSRMDVRQTGADTSAFKGNRRIYHVDCDAAELNNRIRHCRTLVCGLPRFLKRAFAGAVAWQDGKSWHARIGELRSRWPDTEELKDLPGINPNILMQRIAARSPSASAYAVDVGQHQMWAAQSLAPRADQRFLTSGGMGAMGFALPASIGACLAAPGQPVVVVAGDGGFQLNLQELQTVVRSQIPVKMIVVNNQCHGMVRQFQESYFEGRYQSTVWGYSAPSFRALAEAYGLEALSVQDPGALDRALDACFAQPDKPFLLEVVVDAAANAYPKIAFGHPINEMEPFRKPLAMEST